MLLHAALHAEDSVVDASCTAANDYDADDALRVEDGVGSAGEIVALPRRDAVASETVSLGGSHRSKRVLDVVIAAPTLLILLPLLAALWAAVRLTSPGPGLHWSPRVGALTG
jgi:hypothetical protein